MDDSTEGRELFISIWRGLDEMGQILSVMALAKSMGLLSRRLDTICDLSQGTHLLLMGAAAQDPDFGQ